LVCSSGMSTHIDEYLSQKGTCLNGKQSAMSTSPA